MTSKLFALLLVFPLPDITGDSTCPAPPLVRERLAAMANAGPGEAAVELSPHRVFMSNTAQAVHIELLDADGRLLAERSLEQSSHCGDMAEAIAVVLATWEGRFNPDLATKLATLPAAPQPVAAPVVAAPAQPPRSRPMLFDAGLALLTSITGGEVVLGARLDGSLMGGEVPVGLYAALSAAATHAQSTAVPASEARWLRGALAVGPSYRLGKARPGLDIHAGGVLALLHVRGAGLPNPASDTSLQLGVTAGLRGVWVWNSAGVWLGTDLFVYPGDDRLTIGNYGDVGRLPRLEMQLLAGVALGRFR